MYCLDSTTLLDVTTFSKLYLRSTPRESSSRKSCAAEIEPKFLCLLLRTYYTHTSLLESKLLNSITYRHSSLAVSNHAVVQFHRYGKYFIVFRYYSNIMFRCLWNFWQNWFFIDVYGCLYSADIPQNSTYTFVPPKECLFSISCDYNLWSPIKKNLCVMEKR